MVEDKFRDVITGVILLFILFLIVKILCNIDIDFCKTGWYIFGVAVVAFAAYIIYLFKKD